MRLEPIDRPRGPLLKIVYYLSRRKFGKVLAPVRVIYARSTPILMVSKKILETDRKLSLAPDTITLIRYFVSHLNACDFCANAIEFIAAGQKLEQQKLKELLDYRNSTRFTEKEKSLLAYLEEIAITRQATDEVFDHLKRHFIPKEIVEITWVSASENYFNLMAKPLGLKSDDLTRTAAA
jgi:AhpD family alkylhydroperoxidase